MHHIGKEYDNQKQLRNVPKDENMINCINRHQGQRKHHNKINKDKNIIKCKTRGKETPEQQKQRQQYDKAQKQVSWVNETPQKSKD